MQRQNRFYLDRTLRRFIWTGVTQYLTGLSKDDFPVAKVIMANDSLASPDSLFATLRYVGESRSSGHHFQRGDQVYVQQAIHARYLVCFLRDCVSEDCVVTSYDAAQAFIDFVDSHHGIAWAAHAVTDGSLRKVYVYQTNGTGVADTKFDPSAFNPPEDETWSTDTRPTDIVVGHAASDTGEDARARLYVSSNGRIESGFMIDPGTGFYGGQALDLSGIASQAVEGTVLPTAVCVGGGFTIDRPLMIEEDDYPLTENKMERRCMIELDISFIEERKEPGDPKRNVRYEMGAPWIQEIVVSPPLMTLQVPAAGEDPIQRILSVSLSRRPAYPVSYTFEPSDTHIKVESVDKEIDPAQALKYHEVKIKATSGTPVGSHTITIKARTEGRSEDNVQLIYPLRVTGG